VPRVQSYASVQNFARQESTKAAMNHMRWNLASQVCKPFLPRPFSLLRRASRIFAALKRQVPVHERCTRGVS